MNIPQIVSHIELWPLERLIPYAGNPRTHSAAQIKQIAESMRENGFVNPVGVDKFGNVVWGHGRILAAQLIGIPQLPVIVLDHLTETQARALRIADNRIAENAGWDHEKLSAELAALLEEKIDLTSLGFGELELKQVLAELEKQTGHVDDDAVPELPSQPVTHPGDLWILGEHRILCGNSIAPETLTKVLEGRAADLIYADLPYNVAYFQISKTVTSRPILNDDLGKDFPKFLRDSCAAMLAVSGGALYISMSSSELHTLYAAFTQAGGHWSTFVIWAKNTFTLGRSPYQHQFEPILFGWKEGGSHYFCGARNLADVWFIDKPSVNDLHPTMKPVELIERAILHSSRKGDLVLDPFTGSGTTAIACQKTGRRARLIELDPRYVDVTVTRWQTFSGDKATLASSGMRFDDLSRERQSVDVQA